MCQQKDLTQSATSGQHTRCETKHKWGFSGSNFNQMADANYPLFSDHHQPPKYHITIGR